MATFTEQILKDLNHDREYALNSANNAEYDVLKQIILVDSGAIALVGALVVNHGSSAIAFPIQFLLTVAIVSLSVSIITAIIQYLVTKKYFLSLYAGLNKILHSLPNNTAEWLTYKSNEQAKLDHPGNVVPLWIAIITFLSGALVLSSVIIILIW